VTCFYLFNDAVSNSAYIPSNEKMTANRELEGIWKESAMA
jgi:hypothetical protein